MECGALGKMDIVEKLLIDYDQVFFIFDRYNSDSIKGEESCPA